jgi:adenylate cyclase
VSQAASRSSAEARRWRWVLLIATLAGAIYGARFGGVLSGAVTGAATGGLLSGVEIFVLGGVARARLEQLPLAAYLVLRVCIYVVAIVGVDVGVTRLFGQGPLRDNVARGDLSFALTISVAVNLLFGVNDLLGPGVLFAFVAGRYRRPRRETRVLLYVDLCGSTALAERLGEERFLDLLNAVFADVTEEIEAEAGEIHKYVGDEVIAVWRDGTPAERPIRACFASRRRIAERAAYYRDGFGEVPAFRAAIHAGGVVIGELGASKKEIALIGDAMNTAARILEAARDAGALALISAEYFEASGKAPKGIRARRLPPVAMRGKIAPPPLISLEAESGGLSAATGPI